MKIASYNLFEGAFATMPLPEDFARESDVDVLCIQEANGWNYGKPSIIETFAKNTGLNNYVYGNSNTKYKLATLSRVPILSSQVHTEGFRHSAILTTVQLGDTVLDLWNVHLNPRDEDSRLDEARLLTSMIDMAKPTIIMGDFNSLSESDNYPDTLIRTLAAHGIKKFGTNKLRFDVTNYLLASGFVDLAEQQHNQQVTVPTPANIDPHHAVMMRLDYMFATSGVARLVTDFEVPKSPLTDEISDHYPVVLTLQS